MDKEWNDDETLFLLDIVKDYKTDIITHAECNKNLTQQQQQQQQQTITTRNGEIKDSNIGEDILSKALPVISSSSSYEEQLNIEQTDPPVLEAEHLPSVLPPPNRPKVHHASEERPLENNIKIVESYSLAVPAPTPTTSSCGSLPRRIRPKRLSTRTLPPEPLKVPILLVVPSQPVVGPSAALSQTSSSGNNPLFTFQPPNNTATKPNTVLRHKSQKPCTACKIPYCGRMRKKYIPPRERTEGIKQKIFTFCPRTNKSVTPGLQGEFTSYEHFKRVVDKILEKTNVKTTEK